jgi:hypothetical protein
MTTRLGSVACFSRFVVLCAQALRLKYIGQTRFPFERPEARVNLFGTPFAARPEPNFSKMESARAANRRRQRVAPLTDRASMDKDERERERGSVCPIALIFRCRGLAMTP